MLVQISSIRTEKLLRYKAVLPASVLLNSSEFIYLLSQREAHVKHVAGSAAGSGGAAEARSLPEVPRGLRSGTGDELIEYNNTI